MASDSVRSPAKVSQVKSKSSFYGMHPNFIVAKYKNMKHTGKLDKMEQKIVER